MAVRLTVELKGLFFRNPVGQLHKNIYRVLSEAAEAGAAATAAYAPVRSGALRDSIEPRLVKATRYNRFTGRARVIAGARGSWAPEHSPGTTSPWTIAEARNRAVASKVNRSRNRFMFRGAAVLNAWLSSNRGHISAILARLLS